MNNLTWIFAQKKTVHSKWSFIVLGELPIIFIDYLITHLDGNAVWQKTVCEECLTQNSQMQVQCENVRVSQ